jgi:hypothetical protein
MSIAADLHIARERERVAKIMSEPTGVFVFGSNLRGVHGAGAALEAKRRYGAVEGRAIGRMGSSYGIPTKDHWRDRNGLSLERIAQYVKDFIAYAEAHPFDVFALTRIGCGYAGHSDSDIAPLFEDAPENVELPTGWREIAEVESVWNPSVVAARRRAEELLERPIASMSMTKLEADAARWRAIEPLLIDWRDAEHYPTDGTGWSPAQRQAFRTFVGAIDAALLTLKREKETAR